MSGGEGRIVFGLDRSIALWVRMVFCFAVDITRSFDDHHGFPTRPL